MLKIEDHDLGLANDLRMIDRQLIGRRRALGLFASAGTVALLSGCGGETSGSTGGVVTTPGPTPAPTGTCIADPAETAGPYPDDGSNTASGSTSNVLIVSGVIRSDRRAAAITGDDVALRRLFTNLLENALRYGQCAVLTAITRHGHAIVTIDDDGPGIPAAHPLPSACRWRDCGAV